MKKIIIALSILIAMTSCELLVQTPGQPPKIVGIEVDGASDDLYELVGSIASIPEVEWATPTNAADQIRLQVVDGKGSLKFDEAPAFALSDAFKLRVPDTDWSRDLGTEDPGTAPGNFDFNNMGFGFTGGSYIIKITVTSGAGARTMATTELVEATLDDVREPNAVTGAVATGTVDTFIKVSTITIKNATATDLFYLSGEDGAILDTDKGNYTTGFDRYALGAIGADAKDYAFGVGSSNSLDAVDGAVLSGTEIQLVYTIAKDSYDTTTYAKTTVNVPGYFHFKNGGQIAFDYPYKTAAGEVVAANAPLTINNSITTVDATTGVANSDTITFEETPSSDVWGLIYDATANTIELELLIMPDYIVGWELVGATASSQYIMNGDGFGWSLAWDSTNTESITTDVDGNGAKTFAAQFTATGANGFTGVIIAADGSADWGTDRLAADGANATIAGMGYVPDGITNYYTILITADVAGDSGYVWTLK